MSVITLDMSSDEIERTSSVSPLNPEPELTLQLCAEIERRYELPPSLRDIAVEAFLAQMEIGQPRKLNH